MSLSSFWAVTNCWHLIYHIPFGILVYLFVLRMRRIFWLLVDWLHFWCCCWCRHYFRTRFFGYSIMKACWAVWQTWDFNKHLNNVCIVFLYIKIAICRIFWGSVGLTKESVTCVFEFVVSDEQLFNNFIQKKINESRDNFRDKTIYEEIQSTYMWKITHQRGRKIHLNRC